MMTGPKCQVHYRQLPTALQIFFHVNLQNISSSNIDIGQCKRRLDAQIGPREFRVSPLQIIIRHKQASKPHFSSYG